MPEFKIPESVLVVIYSSEMEVLLIERADKQGFWQSVTGSKDAIDEPLIETAIREVQEETGIQIGSERVPLENLHNWQLSNVYEIYPVWRHRYAPHVTHNKERVFGLKLPRPMPIQLSPLEHTEYTWMPWKKAADTCFSPSNAEAILMLPHWLEGLK
jgi:dATP pyrophosphohydrolase